MHSERMWHVGACTNCGVVLGVNKTCDLQIAWKLSHTDDCVRVSVSGVYFASFSTLPFVFPYAPPANFRISSALLYGGAVGGCTGSRLTLSFGS